MRKYDVALSEVESFYSIEMAEGPSYVAFFEETMRATPSYGERILTQLSGSFSDLDFSWRDALWNEDWHIKDFDSKVAARDFVKADILSSVIRLLVWGSGSGSSPLVVRYLIWSLILTPTGGRLSRFYFAMERVSTSYISSELRRRDCRQFGLSLMPPAAGEPDG